MTIRPKRPTSSDVAQLSGVSRATVSSLTLTILFVLFGFGAAFAGEAMYKVWSQELFPTLLRSTAQGVTLAFARLLAALFAFGTPAIAVASPPMLFGLLMAFAIISGVIGLVWIPRLPRATVLESGASEAEKLAVAVR